MPNLAQSVLVRWLIAIIAFPIGGFLGHLAGGPAATIPAAVISGAIAGAVIGMGQALALHLRSQALLLWSAVTAIGLAAALAVVTAVIGQIATVTEAVSLGAVSGLVLGAGQALLLQRRDVRGSWMWVPASAVAWGVGWFVTAGIGVALEAGWPVYGISGALASQLITGIVIWRLMASRPAHVATPA